MQWWTLRLRGYKRGDVAYYIRADLAVPMLVRHHGIAMALPQILNPKSPHSITFIILRVQLTQDLVSILLLNNLVM